MSRDDGVAEDLEVLDLQLTDAPGTRQLSAVRFHLPRSAGSRVLTVVLVVLLSGTIGATLSHHYWKRGSAVKSAGPAARTSPKSGNVVHVPKDQVLFDDWSFNVERFRRAPSFRQHAAPTGWVWVVIDLTVTNRSTDYRALSPEMIELRYLHSEPRFERNIVHGPDRGITLLDKALPPKGREHRRLSFLVPEDANGYVLTLRPGFVGAGELGVGAQVNLSCC